MSLKSVCLVLALAACAPAGDSTDTAADEQAIRSRMETLNQAVTGQSDSILATLYVEEGVLMPPGFPRVAGRAAIKGFWATLWPMKASLTMTTSTIRVSGDWAIEEGNWTWTQPVPPGGTAQDAGKYIQTWQRVDGGWFIVQNIWNSDGPAGASS